MSNHNLISAFPHSSSERNKYIFIDAPHETGQASFHKVIEMTLNLDNAAAKRFKRSFTVSQRDTLCCSCVTWLSNGVTRLYLLF